MVVSIGKNNVLDFHPRPWDTNVLALESRCDYAEQGDEACGRAEVRCSLLKKTSSSTNFDPRCKLKIPRTMEVNL